MPGRSAMNGAPVVELPQPELQPEEEPASLFFHSYGVVYFQVYTATMREGISRHLESLGPQAVMHTVTPRPSPQGAAQGPWQVPAEANTVSIAPGMDLCAAVLPQGVFAMPVSALVARAQPGEDDKKTKPQDPESLRASALGVPGGIGAPAWVEFSHDGAALAVMGPGGIAVYATAALSTAPAPLSVLVAPRGDALRSACWARGDSLASLPGCLVAVTSGGRLLVGRVWEGAGGLGPLGDAPGDACAVLSSPDGALLAMSLRDRVVLAKMDQEGTRIAQAAVVAPQMADGIAVGSLAWLAPDRRAGSGSARRSPGMYGVMSVAHECSLSSLALAGSCLRSGRRRRILAGRWMESHWCWAVRGVTWGQGRRRPIWASCGRRPRPARTRGSRRGSTCSLPRVSCAAEMSPAPKSGSAAGGCSCFHALQPLRCPARSPRLRRRARRPSLGLRLPLEYPAPREARRRRGGGGQGRAHPL